MKPMDNTRQEIIERIQLVYLIKEIGEGESTIR